VTRFVITLAALLLALPAHAQTCYQWLVEGVADGDTLHAGGHKIQLMGFDAAEVRARCDAEAVLARQATVRLQELASEHDVRFCPDGTDRYGRTLTVMLIDGKDVADILIGEGLAREYHGGKREGWCDGD